MVGVSVANARLGIDCIMLSVGLVAWDFLGWVLGVLQVLDAQDAPDGTYRYEYEPYVTGIPKDS